MYTYGTTLSLKNMNKYETHVKIYIFNDRLTFFKMGSKFIHLELYLIILLFWKNKNRNKYIHLIEVCTTYLDNSSPKNHLMEPWAKLRQTLLPNLTLSTS